MLVVGEPLVCDHLETEQLCTDAVCRRKDLS